MQRLRKLTIAALSTVGLLAGYRLAASSEEGGTDWALNASIIEACSCPMFCDCYFNPHPAPHHGEHGEEHFCRFSNAVHINRGHHASVDLTGARFWVAGDLGADFADGRMDWARVHFAPTVTAEQRAAVSTILGRLFGVEWDDFAVGEDAAIEWTHEGDRAVARLGDGQAEIVLTRPPSRNAAAPVVIQNLKWWNAPRNDGFVLMPNDVEAYRLGEKAFEFRGTNGFMITIDMNSGDVAAANAAQ